MRVDRRRRGAAAIEFVLWLNALFLLVSGLVDWATYMSSRLAVTRAAMDGCRIGSAVFEPASMTPGTLSTPLAEDRALEVLESLGVVCDLSDGCDIEATFCLAGSGGDVCGPVAPPFDALVVEVTVEYDPMFGWAATPDVLHESFMMAVENQREPAGTP
ncbi:MAG: TadE family protein [Myxococcota bacterium]